METIEIDEILININSHSNKIINSISSENDNYLMKNFSTNDSNLNNNNKRLHSSQVDFSKNKKSNYIELIEEDGEINKIEKEEEIRNKIYLFFNYKQEFLTH